MLGYQRVFQSTRGCGTKAGLQVTSLTTLIAGTWKRQTTLSKRRSKEAWGLKPRIPPLIFVAWLRQLQITFHLLHVSETKFLFFSQLQTVFYRQFRTICLVRVVLVHVVRRANSFLFVPVKLKAKATSLFPRWSCQQWHMYVLCYK